MTDKFDDGGPAYPIWNDSEFTGMSQRDAFAMAAMQGLVTPDHHYPPYHIASIAYEMADAMIAERNKRRGEG